ncbi:mechanosensitive ion channel family protein [Paucibacter sp. TC2R-5]|uniref:mechanosensitive ion channel domain-containing protein n=1 Tax=Paucibacter sp. TC2R-5 TaxID=2893555 RepID=UPI0021E4C7E3|nr:mechanosensitive ion channel family protein [Paucibacter sp. TC2R-5]MCV2361232.1 mechanosensitive ion channel family protein [Paucibacter sp. TC2R-5]
MTSLMPIFERLAALIPGQWEKVIVTALLIGAALLASHLWARYLSRGAISAEKRRIHLVWARNIIWFAALLIIVSVWASTIAGFALSVAAVAGAILIVSKELVMCVLGYLYVTVVQPYKIGDVIEFKDLHGRVVDIDMFATTLVELDKAGQRTGKVAEFPNGLLLTHALVNSSPNGEYALHAIQIPIPERLSHDLDHIEAAALAAADRATAGWREEAIVHFQRASAENFIALPSGRTKVSWDFSNPEHLVLIVRVACPVDQRAKVEQEVFRHTWRALSPAPQV